MNQIYSLKLVLQTFIGLMLALSSFHSEAGKKTDDIKKMIRTVQELSQSNPDSALLVAKEAYALTDLKSPDSIFLRLHLALAEIYFSTGNYQLAIDYYFKSLHSLEYIPLEELDKRQINNLYVIYNRLGHSYFELDLPELSKSYYRKSSDLIAETDQQYPGLFSSYDQIESLFNIGSVYLKQLDLENAVSTFEEIEILNQDLADTTILLYLANNQGIILFKKGELNKALIKYFDVIEIARNFGDLSILAKLCVNIGKAYLSKGLKEEAKKYFLEAIQSGQIAKDWTASRDAAIELNNIYKENANYREAYYFSELVRQIDDSIFSPVKYNYSGRYFFQHELDKSIRFNQLEQAAKWQTEREQKHLFVLLTIVFALGILASIFIISNILKANKLSKLKQDYLELQANQYQQQRIEIEQELEAKKRQLIEKALSIAQKNEYINDLAKKIDKLTTDEHSLIGEQLHHLKGELKKEKHPKFWKDFDLHFGEAHQEFYRTLSIRYPNLTPGERKLAALLRMNLSTKEVAALTFQNPDSIKVARSRLRKKLELSPAENLVIFLQSL